MIEPNGADPDGSEPMQSGVHSGVSTSLYRFFDAEDRLLYVGITSRGPGRWRDHEEHREWWSRVARSTVEHFQSRINALAAEGTAIRDEHPVYNIVHASVRSVKPTPIYRRHGQGSVIYRPERDRWAAVTPGRRQWYHFRTEAQARAFLDAYLLAADDPEIRRMLILAFGRIE